MNQNQDSSPVSVPTFGRSRSLLEEADSEQWKASTTTTATDAFLFYSNDEVRMRTLSDGIVGASQATTNSTITRKTRISFELHPSIFFDDLLHDVGIDNMIQDNSVQAMNVYFDDLLHDVDTDSNNRENSIKDINDKLHVNGLVISVPEGELQADIRSPRAA